MGRRRATDDPAPTTPDPIEIAMKAAALGEEPGGPARRLLVNQNRLVRTQIASERVGLALKLLTGAAGLVLAVLLAAVVWDAANSRTLVVEPFSVPADLAQRGLTGPVVATRLLDELQRLQNRTLSYRAARSYANWKNDIKVEIPQTGVSIGELQTLLREWLGQETRISGEIVRTADGVALTVRAGAVPGRTFRGSEAQLEALIDRGAESVYGATQPERYAAYLSGRGDTRTADLIYNQLVLSGSRQQRAWAYAMLAAHAETGADAVEKARMALELDDRLPSAWFTLADAYGRLGRDEERLEANRRAAQLLRGPRARDMAPWAAVFHRKQREASAALAVGDLQGAIALYDSAATPTPDQPAVACRNCGGGALLGAAQVAAANHDEAGSLRYAKRAVAALGQQYGGLVEVLTTMAAAQAERDWPRYLAIVDAPSVRQSLAAVYGADQLAISIDPARAEALAGVGRIAEARAVAAGLPADCYACVIARGQIEAAAGDRAAAERLFVQAIRLGPSLPAAHAELARSRLARGDLPAAVKAAREAQERGPRWAEPYKIAGDALARSGDHAAAVRAYERAARHAPAWPALRLAWAASLERLGRTAEAAQQRKLAG